MDISKLQVCFVCFDKYALTPIDYLDTRGISWKFKLKCCVPDVDWNFDYTLCETCIKNLEISFTFRAQCMNSSKDSKQCKMCEETFTTLQELQVHLQCHLQMFKCAQCGTHFNNKLEFEFHKMDHKRCKDSDKAKEKDEVECVVLDDEEMEEDVAESVDQVEVKLQETEIVMVDICDVLEPKLENENITQDEEKCNSNDKNEGFSEDKVSSDGTHECTLCSRVFKNIYSLRRHMKSHTKHPALDKASEETNTCPLCGIYIPNKDNMTRHIATHKRRPYVCEVCKRSFKVRMDLVRHIERFHRGERPHVCPSCSHSFKEIMELTCHMLTHPDVWPYACPVCQKPFKSNVEMKNHHTVMHMDPGTWKYKCDQCDKRYAIKQHMQRHVAMHKMPFQCEHCDRKFVVKRHLDSHVLIHKKPFECESCDKTFVWKQQYDTHKERHHASTSQHEQSTEPLNSEV